MTTATTFVVPAQAGPMRRWLSKLSMDPGLRRGDNVAG
jgi:hypothetical protein